MPSIVKRNSTPGDELRIDSDTVQLIWCVPITTAECQLKLDYGTDALYDLFDADSHPFAFAGDRPSYLPEDRNAKQQCRANGAADLAVFRSGSAVARSLSPTPDRMRMQSRSRLEPVP